MKSFKKSTMFQVKIKKWHFLLKDKTISALLLKVESTLIKNIKENDKEFHDFINIRWKYLITLVILVLLNIEPNS
jgi:hypothetical protein